MQKFTNIMGETVKPMSQLLRTATREYKYTTPEGEGVWCPFTINNMPSLPDPRRDVLRRPGSGKISATKFQIAAHYAYTQVMYDGLGRFPTVADAIRTRLVDGSLPDNKHNYSGADCSGFVLNVLDRVFEERGRDLYAELMVPYAGVVSGYSTSGWTPNRDEMEVVLERAQNNGGLSVREFTDIFRGHNQPSRSVGVRMLLANADPVVGDEIQSADLAVYTPTDPTVLGHVAIILDTNGETDVEFAHSGRRDPLIDIGGIEIFSLPRSKVFDEKLEHGQSGTMSIHRLRALAN